MRYAIGAVLGLAIVLLVGCGPQQESNPTPTNTPTTAATLKSLHTKMCVAQARFDYVAFHIPVGTVDQKNKAAEELKSAQQKLTTYMAMTSHEGEVNQYRRTYGEPTDCP